jgi:hemerythrin-like domain-containing protein
MRRMAASCAILDAMTRPTQIQAPGSAPGASFDQPFGMLEACHERLHRTLALLQRLREHLATHGADAQAQQAAVDVMRYFDQAAPQHHQDEELHVFPPLLAAGDPAVVRVVRQLQAEHLEMESTWERARAMLVQIAEGRLSALNASENAAINAFASLYANHIAAEEQVAYPAARASMDEQALAVMGDDMRRRRNAPRG